MTAMLTHTMPDLRSAVLTEMKRQDVSTYALIKLLKGKRDDGTDVPMQTVYQFIRKQTKINSDDLGLIFDALGMVATRSDLARVKHRKPGRPKGKR